MEKNAIFENCFNHIIAHQHKDSYYSFAENYYKYPEHVHFLYGVIASHILLKTTKEGCHFLETEKNVSPHAFQISLVHTFVKKNNYFASYTTHDTLFNIGLFLKNNNFRQAAHVFFRVCQVLHPENTKTLSLLAESALLNNNIAKGIKLFSQAAVNK
jgi:hypothetical protein